MPTPSDEWSRVVSELVSAPEWVMDGNFGGSMRLRIPQCDAVVLFDFPRSVCLWNVVKRRIRFAGTSRPDMTEGCNAGMRDRGQHVAVLRVRNRAAVQALLDETRGALDH